MRNPGAWRAQFHRGREEDGKVVWKDSSPGDRILHGQWSSPALGEVAGLMQVFFPGGDGWLYGFNALTRRKTLEFRPESQGCRVAQNAQRCHCDARLP